LLGYMTMAPFGATPETLSEIFTSLTQFRNDMESEFSISLPDLSMGMSGDFEEAISSGATYVRIGTAIFGERLV